MIKYERPPEPADWPESVEALQRAVAAQIDLIPGSVRSREALIEAFKTPKSWSTHKMALSEVQHGKCAYCERDVTGYRDMEHVWPKAAVAVLGDEGVEDATTKTVKGRSSSSTVQPGYWWCAYSWSNYCFACNQCNTKWKKTFLTVDPAHSDHDPPRPDRSETVYLIHPYDVDPEDHLSVDPEGQLTASTPLGQETIRTLGLNRPSQVQARQHEYSAAQIIVQHYLLNDDEPLRGLLKALSPKRTFSLARRCAIRPWLGEDHYQALKAEAEEEARH